MHLLQWAIWGAVLLETSEEHRMRSNDQENMRLSPHFHTRKLFRAAWLSNKINEESSAPSVPSQPCQRRSGATDCRGTPPRQADCDTVSRGKGNPCDNTESAGLPLSPLSRNCCVKRHKFALSLFFPTSLQVTWEGGGSGEL